MVQRWRGHDVAFPSFRRTFTGGYASIASSRLHAVVAGRFARASGSALRLGARAVRIGAREVELAEGEVLSGALVVDARGPEAMPSGGRCAFQKFVGIEWSLARAHTLARPMLMDATVEQRDGLRFFYVLATCSFSSGTAR